MNFYEPSWFLEPVLFENEIYPMIYEEGRMKSRRVAEHEILDSRPFIWGKLSTKNPLGKAVVIRKKTFFIEAMEPTGDETHVYFLTDKQSPYRK